MTGHGRLGPTHLGAGPNVRRSQGPSGRMAMGLLHPRLLRDDPQHPQATARNGERQTREQRDDRRRGFARLQLSEMRAAAHRGNAAVFRLWRPPDHGRHPPPGPHVDGIRFRHRSLPRRDGHLARHHEPGPANGAGRGRGGPGRRRSHLERRPARLDSGRRPGARDPGDGAVIDASGDAPRRADRRRRECARRRAQGQGFRS